MEFQFLSAPIGTTHGALEEHGAALLRRAIPPERVQQFKAALDRIYTAYDLDKPAFDRFGEGGAAAVGQGDVSLNLLKHFSGLGIDDYFDMPKLTGLARLCLSQPYPDLQTAMSVSPTLGRSTQGFNLHTDGIIQGTDRAALAYWSPLDDCGVDAPGLRVVPASRRRVIAYLRRQLPTKPIPG